VRTLSAASVSSVVGSAPSVAGLAASIGGTLGLTPPLRRTPYFVASRAKSAASSSLQSF